MRASLVFAGLALVCALVVLFRQPIRLDAVAFLAAVLFALAVGARFFEEVRDGHHR